MAKTVGDFVVERLRAWGVQRVFGYPGDGINGITAGFEHAGDERPRFIQARHEELAALMAGVHLKFFGVAGGGLAPSGPKGMLAATAGCARPPRPACAGGLRRTMRRAPNGRSSPYHAR